MTKVSKKNYQFAVNYLLLHIADLYGELHKHGKLKRHLLMGGINGDDPLVISRIIDDQLSLIRSRILRGIKGKVEIDFGGEEE